jgi:hypothetical protein
MVAQNGLSVEMTKTVHAVRAATAKFALRERAPITKKGSSAQRDEREASPPPSGTYPDDREIGEDSSKRNRKRSGDPRQRGKAGSLENFEVTDPHQLQVKPENEDVAEVSLKQVAGKQEPEARGTQRPRGKLVRTRRRDSVGLSASSRLCLFCRCKDQPQEAHDRTERSGDAQRDPPSIASRYWS